MTATLQFFKPDGTLQFDSSIPTYVFHSKGTVTTMSTTGANPHWSTSSPSSALIPMVYDADELIAVRIGDGHGIARYADLSYNGNWWHIYHTSAPVGSPVTYYRFVPATQVPGAVGAGFELFNEAGQRTYSSAMKPLIIGGMGSGIGTSYTLPAGRAYASIAPSLGGHQHVSYDSVVQSEQNEKGQTISRWYDMYVDGKLYGVSWSGTTASLVQVSFNDQTAQYGIPLTGAPPPPPPPSTTYFLDITDMMFVDVTGL